MATYTVVSVGTHVSGSGPLSPVPGTHAVGDLLLLISAARTTAQTSSTDPSGYTLLGAAVNGTGFEIWGAIATSSSMPTPSIAWGAVSLAWIVVLRSSTGWPAIGSIVAHLNQASFTTTNVTYQDLTVTENDCLTIQAQTKATTTADVNPITAVAVSSGWTSAGAKFNNVAFSLLTSVQVRGQTTATNLVDTTVAVTGNADSGASRGISLALRPGSVSSPPTFTSFDSDDIVTSTQTNVSAVGTNLGTSGLAELVDGSIRQTLAQVSWTATLVRVNMSLGNCRYGSGKSIVLTPTGGTAVSRTITLNPPSGTTVVNLTTLRALTFDSRNRPTRLYSSPDIPNNAQVEFTGTATIDVDGRLQWPVATTQLPWRFHNGTVWSAQFLWDLSGLAAVYLGPAPTTRTFPEDVAITPINHSVIFSNEEGLTLTYSISPALPVGESFSTTTAIESGTPTTPGTTSGHVIRAAIPGGVYAEAPAFGRIIEATPNPPRFIGFIAPITGYLGESITPVDAGSQFENCTGFAFDPAAPAGISIHPTTGLITGTPTVAGTTTGVTVVGSGDGTPASSNTFSFDFGLERVPIPIVVGRTRTQAIADFQAVGLVESISEEFSSTVAFDVVISQSLTGDVSVGTVIPILVSKGTGEGPTNLAGIALNARTVRLTWSPPP